MKEQNCELCELHELCKEYLRPSPYQVITCEAFKAAIRDYGGVDKLYKDLYDALKQAIETEEKQDVNKPLTYDRLLQSYSFGAISEGFNEDGFVLHSSNVPSERCGQSDAFRFTSVH